MNVTATPSADGRECDVKYLPPISIYHKWTDQDSSVNQNTDSRYNYTQIKKVMENLKLISVRIEPETLRLIDKYAKRHDYYKRSAIINSILAAVIKCSDPQTLWKILTTWQPEKSGYEITFKVSEKKLEHIAGQDV